MRKKTIEISVKDLKNEVKELLASMERDRITPRPLQRIGEILDATRRYMSAVVKANAPRNFSPGSERSPKQREILRAHREAHRANADPKTGLNSLMVKLKSLDCTFVLAGEVAWRLDELDWEMKVWRPLYRWAERGFTMLYGEQGQGDWPRYVPESDLHEWEEEEKEIEWGLMSRIGEFWPEGDYPVVDDSSFTVKWRGKEGYVGNNACFRLLKALAEAKGSNVSHEKICSSLRKEDMSSDALRKLVQRLRKTLRNSDCHELAAAIITKDAGHIRLDVSCRRQ